MNSVDEKLNIFLRGEKIPLYEYKDLKFVIECGHRADWARIEHVLQWFRFLQSHEVVGWRPKPVTRKIADLLFNNSSYSQLRVYALMCPAYKKGDGEFGLKTGGVGKTTIIGIENLHLFYDAFIRYGFHLGKPLVIFFDLALEQYDKIIAESDWLDKLKENGEYVRKLLPAHFEFMRLSDVLELKIAIGHGGLSLPELPVPHNTYERIVERGAKFYEQFGWSEQQIRDRSYTIASSEATVGNFLWRMLPSSLMIYTPTMLERAAVYSGMNFSTDPLPFVVPSKGP